MNTSDFSNMANAFDVLILPILEWTVGMIVTFPIIHGLRIGLGRLFGALAPIEPAPIPRSRVLASRVQPASPGFHRS